MLADFFNILLSRREEARGERISGPGHAGNPAGRSPAGFLILEGNRLVFRARSPLFLRRNLDGLPRRCLCGPLNS
jgi:hypothetical protein